MPLPPLYKYLDVKGAKLTLSNQTFRHAKPSDFNDVEDMTLGSIFPEDVEVALKKLSDNFTDVVAAHLSDEPTCSSPSREQLKMIQQVFRANPEAINLVKEELKKDGAAPLFDVEHMRERARAHLTEINEFMQDWRIFCATTHKNSDRMWKEYAENHKGIVLRIEPNVAKDSKFQSFQPVIYRNTRPAFYDDTMNFLADGLFADQEVRARALMDKIVYAKTLKWQHEGEYRLAIPLHQGEKPFDTESYHPEEVTELYLGRSMDAKDRDEIVALARKVNPQIKIEQA